MKAATGYILTLIIISGIFQGCSHPNFNTPGHGKRPIYGKASYYGAKFHGRKTANGETFNMHGMTAAHRTLPFGTVCRVTNRANGRSVTVRINDRGPFIKGRILDLSRGAAKAIDGLNQGVMDVRIDIVRMGK